MHGATTSGGLRGRGHCEALALAGYAVSGATLWWHASGADRGKPWIVRHQSEYFLCERWSCTGHCSSLQAAEGLPEGPRGALLVGDFRDLLMHGVEKVTADIASAAGRGAQP